MGDPSPPGSTNLAYLDGGPFEKIDDIAILFRNIAEKYPDSEAVVSVHQKPACLPGIEQNNGTHRLSWTYKQLKDASDLLADRLVSLGICKGTAIAFFSDNYAEWALFCWAAVRIGCPFVPLNPAVISKKGEAQYILQVICPGVIVVRDKDTALDLERNAEAELSESFIKLSISPLDGKPLGELSDTKLGEQLNHNIGEESSTVFDWINLSDLLSRNSEHVSSLKPDWKSKKSFDNSVTIGFTSGTTSSPKACPQSSTNIGMACAMYRTRGVGPGLRVLLHTPSYHAIACIGVICCWANGGTIVYPSARFDVMASLDTVEKECCTSMAAVPTMIKLISVVPNVSEKLKSLQSIDVAGTQVFPEVLQICRDILGIKNVCVAWGMTENTAALLTMITPEMEINLDEAFPVGRPVPGMRVKVCAPGSRIPLPRGEEGELHAGGPQVIRGYLNAKNDVFYEDEDCRWIMTGDMASIDHDGQVRILGRYKDIIIRGGVNIAPAMIERCLNKFPGTDCQVIGIPDQIAGEVPVAIVKVLDSATENQHDILFKPQEAALRDLGPKLVPVLYFDLKHDLNMQTFPMTTSGKIQKRVLREKVMVVISQRSQEGGKQIISLVSTDDILSQLWSQVSGVDPNRISKDVDVSGFADSITMMRFCSAVKVTLRKDICIAEILQNPTIQQQARFLDLRPIFETESNQIRAGPPTAKNMVHCNGDDTLAANTQYLATPLLTRLGLGWTSDVEDVIPTPDTLSIYLRATRPQTWNQRAIFIAHNTSRGELVDAWKATLHHHPIMRTLVIKSEEFGQHLLIVLRDNEQWWRCSLSQHLNVSNIEELRTVLADEWADPAAGPLVKVAFVTIDSCPGDTAMILIANHGAFDNISGNLFFEDLLVSIQKRFSPINMGDIQAHASFKIYADKYYLHHNGNAAKRTIDYHANRLRGIGAFTDALWPPRRAPGWFKGVDTGWKNVDGTPGDPRLRVPIDFETELFGLDGLTRTVNAPGLNSIREVHGLPPHVILKSAVALFNIHRTKSSTALFANLEAARNWPFTSDWEAKYQNQKGRPLPNPLDVAGPMFEVVVNRIEISDHNEPVINFLRRVHANQLELTEQSHVPLFELLKALPPDDALVVREVMDRQVWNWPAGIQAQAQAVSSSQTDSWFEKVYRAAFDDVGLAWTCGLWAEETFYLNASYDDCQLGKDEAFNALGQVLSAAAWLAANVENSVGNVIFHGDVGSLIPSLE